MALAAHTSSLTVFSTQDVCATPWHRAETLSQAFAPYCSQQQEVCFGSAKAKLKESQTWFFWLRIWWKEISEKSERNLNPHCGCGLQQSLQVLWCAINSPCSAFLLLIRTVVDFLPQLCSPWESNTANKTILDHLQLLLLIDCHWVIPHWWKNIPCNYSQSKGQQTAWLFLRHEGLPKGQILPFLKTRILLFLF